MDIKLTLSKQDLLSKVFTVGANNCYNALEVDEFLDSIIKDYATVEKNVLISQSELDALNQHIADLEAKVKSLEINNASLNNKYAGLKTNGLNDDNLGLLKRISVLEKFLWNHGYYPDQIK